MESIIDVGEIVLSGDDRYCTICNTNINYRSFGVHLKNKHSLTHIEYYNLLALISVIPKCGNPNCNNNAVWKNYYEGYSKVCSPGCVVSYKWATDDEYRKMRSSVSSKNMNNLWKDSEFSSERIKYFNSEKHKKFSSSNMKNINNRRLSTEEGRNLFYEHNRRISKIRWSDPNQRENARIFMINRNMNYINQVECNIGRYLACGVEEIFNYLVVCRDSGSIKFGITCNPDLRPAVFGDNFLSLIKNKVRYACYLELHINLSTADYTDHRYSITSLNNEFRTPDVMNSSIMSDVITGKI